MTTLLLVGCGKMGGALLARWKAAHKIIVIDPAAKAGDNIYADLGALPASTIPDIVVFAVKPQQMGKILPAYAKRFPLRSSSFGGQVGTAPLYISIAAGKSLAGLANILGKQASIVRAMPNTPALIGEGMTALCASASVSAAHRKTAAELMAAVGKVIWLDNEKLMDAVTAISGSGPAYVFLFMEALESAAIQCGLPEEVATALVRQTVKGSALLAETEDFDALRKQVASPGGTTEAALKILQGKGLDALICEAAEAAMQRAHELNNIDKLNS